MLLNEYSNSSLCNAKNYNTYKTDCLDIRVNCNNVEIAKRGLRLKAFLYEFSISG